MTSLDTENQGEITQKTHRKASENIKSQVKSLVGTIMEKLGQGQDSKEAMIPKIKVLMEDGSKLKVTPALSDIQSIKTREHSDSNHNFLTPDFKIFHLTGKIGDHAFEAEYRMSFEAQTGRTYRNLEGLKIGGKSVDEKQGNHIFPQLYKLFEKAITPEMLKNSPLSETFLYTPAEKVASKITQA